MRSRTQLPEVIASRTGLNVQNDPLVSPAVVESMGRISGKRSPAQLAQTHRLRGPRQFGGRHPSEAEVTLLQAHRHNEVGRDAQKNLRNEWKRSKRAKARCSLAAENQVFGRKLTGLLTDHATDQQTLARLLRAQTARGRAWSQKESANHPM